MRSPYAKALLALVALSIIFFIVFAGARIVSDTGDNLVAKTSFLVAPSGARTLEASVENKTDERTFSSITADIEYLDRDGQVVDSKTFTKDILGPGQIWEFEDFEVPSEAVEARIRASSPDNARP